MSGVAHGVTAGHARAVAGRAIGGVCAAAQPVPGSHRLRGIRSMRCHNRTWRRRHGRGCALSRSSGTCWLRGGRRERRHRSGGGWRRSRRCRPVRGHQRQRAREPRDSVQRTHDRAMARCAADGVCNVDVGLLSGGVAHDVTVGHDRAVAGSAIGAMCAAAQLVPGSHRLRGVRSMRRHGWTWRKRRGRGCALSRSSGTCWLRGGRRERRHRSGGGWLRSRRCWPVRARQRDRAREPRDSVQRTHDRAERGADRRGND